MTAPGSEADYSWSHESNRRRQVRRGLELSAVERLRWLETTMAEMASLLGRAADKPTGRKAGPSKS